MNVRVSTKKVIAQLEKKLAELKNLVTAAEAYEEAIQKWQESVVKELTSAKNWPIVNSNFPTWLGNNKVEMTFIIPDKLMKLKPKKPDGELYGARPSIPEIEHALRILKMTDDETVSASTFKSITKFL